ncbi:ubiquitin-protein ligase molybdopterin-converting factor, partial [Mycena filopes]
MAIELDRLLHSHRAQLVATAVAATATTAGLISLYTTFSKRSRRKDLNQDILRSISSAGPAGKLPLDGSKNPTEGTSTPTSGLAYDEDLIREQLARNYAFFGEDSMAKIRKGTVVVVGCGGVGSWAAVMLVRSGISKIRIVDFDYVTLSSLNRHAAALLPDVGTPKVRCLARTLKQIARWAEVDERIELWRDGADGARLLEGADWVVDAIDNIQTKVDLLKYCHEKGIKVFSSMGAGAKCDPTRIQISDISATVYDPLARAVRRRLRLLGVSSGIPVVYSTEVPSDVRLLPLPEDEFQKGKEGAGVQELSVLDDFRVRILPVLGPLPALFGLHTATYILAALADKPIAHPLPVKNRHKVYERLLRDLMNREAKARAKATEGEVGEVGRLPLNEDDVNLIFEDLHRGGRSVLPPHAVCVKPTLVVWDPAPADVGRVSVENVVVMEAADAARHVGPEMWGEDVRAVVRRRREE